jgi:hypothetical protein
MGFALGGSFASIAPINVFQWIASINMIGLTLFAWVVCIGVLVSLCVLVVLISRRYLYKTISYECFRIFQNVATVLATLYAIWCAGRLILNVVIFPVNFDQKLELELTANIILWVLAPPIYFFIEYQAVDNDCINDFPKSEENLKTVKNYAEYAAKVWAGVLALLAALIALKVRK